MPLLSEIRRAAFRQAKSPFSCPHLVHAKQPYLAEGRKYSSYPVLFLQRPFRLQSGPGVQGVSHRGVNLFPKYKLSIPRGRFMAASVTSSSGGTNDVEAEHKHTNRLANEQSPYLLQHQHNPVDWYPWGEEAFAKAKAENKPIFLSVGYSTCHWCHVMEVESFESEEVAELMNKWFVNIKVDREERPDVDKVYMTYVQATTGGGGWPMSVFLTPDLKPIVGGTYFPPTDKYGQPGFKSVLSKVREAWDTRREDLQRGGASVVQQLADATVAKAESPIAARALAPRIVSLCATQLARRFDANLGGFGGAPKFPRPSEISVMMRSYLRQVQRKESASSQSRHMVLFSLQAMARGGMHDHVGGGFHRYSVDEFWHVPHFEKMLYDEAQLANSYLDAFSISGDAHYALLARDILDYLRRDMTHPEGGIFTAEDADSAEAPGDKRKKEGAFYVWAKSEIEDILGEERAKIFNEHYFVKPNGNCTLSARSDPHGDFRGKNVLIERSSVAETAAKLGLTENEVVVILGECRRLLYAVREQRPHPQLDDKVLVTWNGLAISAFARASRILQSEPPGLQYYFPVDGCKPGEYRRAAERAAAFVKDKLYDPGTKRLKRGFRLQPMEHQGFLDDYAYLINGLLDLFEATGDTQWLSWALDLQRTQDELFLDANGGGYFSVAEGDDSILIRMKEDYDGAEPSGNSVAAINLLRLSAFATGDLSDEFRSRAEHTLSVFEGRLSQVPLALPLMCCAMDQLASVSKRQVVVAGTKGAPDTERLLAAAHFPYDADRVIALVDADDENDRNFWKEFNNGILALAVKGLDNSALVHICQNFSCKPPTSNPEEVIRLIQEAPSSPKLSSFDLNVSLKK